MYITIEPLFVSGRTSRIPSPTTILLSLAHKQIRKAKGSRNREMVSSYAVILFFITLIAAVSASVNCTKTPCPKKCECSPAKICLNKKVAFDGALLRNKKHGCNPTDTEKNITSACTDCLKKVGLDSLAACVAGAATASASKKAGLLKTSLVNVAKAQAKKAQTRKASCVSSA